MGVASVQEPGQLLIRESPDPSLIVGEVPKARCHDCSTEGCKGDENQQEHSFSAVGQIEEFKGEVHPLLLTLKGYNLGLPCQGKSTETPHLYFIRPYALMVA